MEKIEQHKQSLRSHTERVIARAHEVKELSNTGGFEKQRKYLNKIQKSIKNKEKEDKVKLEVLKESHEKRLGQIDTNLKDLKHRLKDQLRYYDKRLKERYEKVDELRAVIREDNETKKELNMLRKADQEENYHRSLNIHNIYKQKLLEKIIEKRERAEKIKE